MHQRQMSALSFKLGFDPTTGFKTSFDCDRLQSLWVCVLGRKGSQRAPARFRALFTSGLDHKLFARSRHKTGFETSCRKFAPSGSL